jgi:hypothetical protein
MESRRASEIVSLLVLALAALGCAADTDDDFDPADMPANIAAPPDARGDGADGAGAEAAPDVATSPDHAPGAEADADVGGDAVDAVEAAPVRSAEWICLGDNPDRIGGCRNGSEVCDDDAFQVTEDLLGPLVLACFAGDQGNGIAFVATNTGPQCELPTCSGLVNDRPRCQGWEKCECENAWDAGNTQYASDGLGPIMILSCPPEGTTRDVDLSAYAGQNMWVGVHTQPDGVGRMTEVCLSKKVW